MNDVIPDGIEPVEAWRAWILDGATGHLRSFNKIPWEPGKRQEAYCLGVPHRYEYVLAKNGKTLEQIRTEYDSYWQNRPIQVNYYYVGSPAYPSPPPPPSVLPPPGYGYTLEAVRHEAPETACTCGIYAVTSRDAVPSLSSGTGGVVMGKVKMWGTVVPGTDGYRAEFAYPSELYVTEKQAKIIADYGVPLVLDAAPSYSGHLDEQKDSLRGMRRFLLGAALLNLGFAAFNIVQAVH